MKLVKVASSDGIYQGVVCALKDNYGFIERADIVKEIFFHFSEFHDDLQCLALGDDVQFSVQTRNVSCQLAVILNDVVVLVGMHLKNITLIEKMVLFHIAAVGWISPQTGYEIQGSISTQN